MVDEVDADSICDQIPLPHGQGSVNFRFSMIPSSLEFQVRSPLRGHDPLISSNRMLSGRKKTTIRKIQKISMGISVRVRLNFSKRRCMK